MATKNQVIDKEKVKELYFYTINNGNFDFYTNKVLPLLQNYTKKYIKGVFDKKNAIEGFKGILPLANAKYCKDYCAAGQKFTFNAAEKDMYAKDLYDYYEEIMKAMFKKAKKLKK